MLLVVVTVALLVVPSVSQINSSYPVFGVAPLLQCPGRDDSVQREIVRHGLYEYLNYMRRGIATGVDMFPNVTFKNHTRLMYAIKYDCDLEGSASEVLKNGKTVPSSHVGLKYESHKPGDKFLGAAEIRKALEKWNANRPAQYMFLYPYVPLFACAHSYENKLLKLLCVFKMWDYRDRISNKTAEDVFRDSPEERNENLPPCQKHTDCKRYANSTCDYNLCWAPFGL